MTYLKQLFFKRRPIEIIVLFRLLFCLGILWEINSVEPLLLGQKSSLKCEPTFFFDLFNFQIPDVKIYQSLINVLKLSLITSAIGLATRLSLVVSFLAFCLVIGESINCATQGGHGAYVPWSHCIVVFNLFILIITPNISASSFDSIVKKYFFPKKASYGYVPNWPIWLLKFNLVYSYFAGGIVKANYGFEWVNGYTLQKYLLYRHLYLDTPWGLWLAEQFDLILLISYVTFFLELLFPLALFCRRFAIFAVLVSMAGQVIFYHVTELRWMHFFGWSYLIYLLEFIFYKKKIHLTSSKD